MDERKWRLAAIFQEVHVDDRWKMKTESIYSRVTLGLSDGVLHDGGLRLLSSHGRARNETPHGAEHVLPHASR